MTTAENGGPARSPVLVEDDAIVARLPDGPLRLPLITAPEDFASWLDEGRRAMYEQLTQGSSPVRFFSQHLPMVVSHNADSTFPFTCGNKGVGYLPRSEHLPAMIRRYTETIEESKGKPWQESLQRRVQTASVFILNPDLVDRRCLATLEIFERQTFQNLQRMPLASLLFTGYSPSFTSFQANCVVEVIGPGDPRHTFITLARTMFEYDEFHITQHQFPYAYVFWLSEVILKTPFRVARKAPPPAKGELSLPWDDEALEAVGRAPAMIQAHIRQLVERYASDRGFERITPAVVREARENLMDGR